MKQKINYVIVELSCILLLLNLEMIFLPDTVLLLLLLLLLLLFLHLICGD
jgi:hypothetical protein